jgi:urease gamma subunit
MGHAVHKLEPREVAQDFATVIEIDGPAIVVESEWGRREGRRAEACLLEPKIGDRVLVAERGEEIYVLSVLAREDAGPARLTLERDLEIAVKGRFAVIADRGVELLTQNAVRMVSSAFSVRAKEGELSVDRLAVIGQELLGNTRVAKLVGSVLETVADRVQQHAKRSYRTIEEGETLRAKRIDYRTEEECSLRGRHAFVHAAELVKVTGAQIHMG